MFSPILQPLKETLVSPSDRHAWLEQWLTERRYGDVLDSELVLSYCEATGADSELMHIGSPRCRQLGRDLSAMYAMGRLKRSATGLPAGDSSMGFPKWVYYYSLKQQ